MVALRTVGKAVAIGRPSEALPHLGASRLYLGDTDWQQRVAARVRTASLGVVRTGIGDGLRWEVEHVMRAVRPEQLVEVSRHKVHVGVRRPSPPATFVSPDDAHSKLRPNPRPIDPNDQFTRAGAV